MAVGAGVGVGEADGVGLGVALRVGVGDGVGVAVGVGDGVGVAVGVELQVPEKVSSTVPSYFIKVAELLEGDVGLRDRC